MQEDTIRPGSKYRVRIGGSDKCINVVTICRFEDNPRFWLCEDLATEEHVSIRVEDIEAAHDDELRR